MKKNEKQQALAILQALYPDAKPALRYNTPYELLVAVVLSAQCTDERVNKVTAVLFEKYNTPEKMVTLTQDELEKYIFSCGFYRMKAEHILSASKDILEKFDGEVPNTIEKLMSLAGVGKNGERRVFGGVWRRCDRGGYARVSGEQSAWSCQRQNAFGSGSGVAKSDPKKRLVKGASLAHLARAKGVSFPKTELRGMRVKRVLRLRENG